jgi:TolB protein
MNALKNPRLGRYAVVPALAIAGLLAAGCGGASVSSAGASGHGQASGVAGHVTANGASGSGGQAAPVATVSHVSASMLGAGQTGPRAAVPWKKIGPGWELAQYSQRSVASAAHPKAGPATLFLVDPEGGRYRMFRWPASATPPRLLDWSGDKSRALLSAGSGVVQITLATGKVTRFTLPYSFPLQYTRPDGQNVLAFRANGTGQIARYNLRGKLQRVLAPAGLTGPYGAALESPGGATVVIADANGLRLVSNTGHLIRSLRAGYPGAGCMPVRWWGSGDVLATCAEKATGRYRLYSIPVSGRPTTALTPWRTSHGADPLGDINGWQLPTGFYLQAAAGCSFGQVVKENVWNGVHLVTIPGTGNDNHVLGALGSRLLVQAGTGCMGSNSLLWFNTATRGVQTLIKAPKTVQGVIAAVPFYAAPSNA